MEEIRVLSVEQIMYTLTIKHYKQEVQKMYESDNSVKM
jgi:hypothetical protein